jgi:pimeloyl-ACP methyl ester carboxylesterase
MKLFLLSIIAATVSGFSPSVRSFHNSRSATIGKHYSVKTGRDLNIEVEDGINICYDAIKEENPAGPPVLYLPGLLSPKSEGKSINLRAFCKKQGYTFLSADYYGTGKSSGNFVDGTVSRWTQDTIYLIEKLLLRQGQVVLVGHGVGAWIAFLVASSRPDLVSGIVGLAADPDFTEELLWKSLDDDVKNRIMTEGVCEIKWGNDKYLISRNLIEDGRKNLLLTGGKGSISREPFPLM